MQKIDTIKEIRRAVDTGKVIFGQKQALKSVLTSQAKAVVLAKNCPKFFSEKILSHAKISKINFLEVQENGLELGAICGKPFNVSILAIQEFGKSNLAGIFKNNRLH